MSDAHETASPGSYGDLEGVLVRNAGPGDLNFIYANLLRDLRDADPSALPDELWFPPHRTWLDRTLADPAVVTLIAAAADNPREILGFVVARPEEVLEWVFVRKGPLRGKGIARLLLSRARCPQTVPARWGTRLGRERLLNPVRSRKLRRPDARSSAGPRAGSTPSSSPTRP